MKRDKIQKQIAKRKEQYKPDESKVGRKTIQEKAKETEIRRLEVTEMLLKGYLQKDVIRRLSEKYGVTTRTLQSDVKLALKNIYISYETKIPELIDEHIAKYKYIYREAMEANDLKSALSALASVEKLLKLHNIETQVNIQQNTIDLKNLSMSELKELLNEGNKSIQTNGTTDTTSKTKEKKK